MKNQIIDENFLSRLEAVSMYMSNPMRGYFGGTHRTKTYGNTVEFADFREYQLGDDIRRIDWNLYSRFEKYFIRLFVDEKQMHIQIFLDGSASMFKGDPGKAHFAMKTAAALAFLSVRNMDKTSVRLINDAAVETVGGLMTGKSAFYRSMAALDKVKFRGDADIGKAITTCMDPGKDDGLTVIISDFFTESDFKQAIDFLIYRKRQVLCIQILSPDEIDPSYSGKRQLLDSEASERADSRHMKMRITRNSIKIYKQALAEYQAELKSFCNARGVPFITCSSADTVESLVFGKLNEWEVVR